MVDVEIHGPDAVDETCAVCGQADGHPMVHTSHTQYHKDSKTIILDPSIHFDCLPAEIIPPADDPRSANLHATRSAALSGVHGDELREYIHTLPDDNNIAPDVAPEITEPSA